MSRLPPQQGTPYVHFTSTECWVPGVQDPKTQLCADASEAFPGELGLLAGFLTSGPGALMSAAHSSRQATAPPGRVSDSGPIPETQAT